MRIPIVDRIAEGADRFQVLHHRWYQRKPLLFYWDTPIQSPAYPDFWITFQGVLRGTPEGAL